MFHNHKCYFDSSSEKLYVSLSTANSSFSVSSSDSRSSVASLSSTSIRFCGKIISSVHQNDSSASFHPSPSQVLQARSTRVIQPDQWYWMLDCQLIYFHHTLTWASSASLHLRSPTWSSNTALRWTFHNQPEDHIQHSRLKRSRVSKSVHQISVKTWEV